MHSVLTTTFWLQKLELTSFTCLRAFNIPIHVTLKTISWGGTFTWRTRYLKTSIYLIKGDHEHAFHKRNLEKGFSARISLRDHLSYSLSTFGIAKLSCFLPQEVSVSPHNSELISKQFGIFQRTHTKWGLLASIGATFF